MAGRIGCQAIGQVDCRSLVELGCLLQRRGGKGSHSFVGMRNWLSVFLKESEAVGE